jgi:hypothetical protein
MSAVPSVEKASTTTTSSTREGTVRSVYAIPLASFQVGMMTETERFRNTGYSRGGPM